VGVGRMDFRIERDRKEGREKGWLERGGRVKGVENEGIADMSRKKASKRTRTMNGARCQGLDTKTDFDRGRDSGKQYNKGKYSSGWEMFRYSCTCR